MDNFNQTTTNIDIVKDDQMQRGFFYRRRSLWVLLIIVMLAVIINAIKSIEKLFKYVSFFYEVVEFDMLVK